MRYRYFICDVFTDQRFGGNPLAVLPQAEGLSERQMQQLAREFNFSESTFVFPSKTHTRNVRIFTPLKEIPFAGHPNIGTAFALASAGEFGPFERSVSVTFEEAAGPVPITVERTATGIRCELQTPEPLSLGKTASAEAVAAAVSLPVDAIQLDNHPPQEASVGLPFLCVELRDRAALQRARVAADALDALAAAEISPAIHLYVRGDDEFDLYARMFAPLHGLPEDPATGSANCALAGLLAHLQAARVGIFEWRISQGIEMGRPSVLEARSEKRDGHVVSTAIAGPSVMVSEGWIEVDDEAESPGAA
ncbi:PhzF family phenazine biosynthesis protein [Haliangium ochraceum]|uniref:Phenazine biosynthesis protein PhzF family n=1 Tax=Haliangium ochraceum (strain DSM 14365 / JCM 11303 / SMP-2) TaxID=502025 RepID=D0LNT5_HALO1|nr:PhzF family phenazine biosynthesis protein [Haliangium ochraceum]ACY18761.1 phenazine biosynthesis protein PhzF family [Haliangium ochraceum DSM 14365]